MQTVGKYFFYAPTFEGKSQDEKITRCGRSLKNDNAYYLATSKS